MSLQRTWSKVKSSIDGPVRTRMDLYKRHPSVKENHYGTLKAIRGEESYDKDFKFGIQIKINFNDDFSAHSDKWLPLDIDSNDLQIKFGSVESINTRIAQGEIFHTCYSCLPTKFHSGSATITSDLSQILNKNDIYEAHSLGTLINGIDKPTLKVGRLIKPAGYSIYKSALDVSDGQVFLAADGKNFIELNSKGLTIGAEAVNIQALPDSVKFGGIISMQSAFLGLIPSTGVTPIPQYTLNLPVEGLELLANIASIMSSIVGT